MIIFIVVLYFVVGFMLAFIAYSVEIAKEPLDISMYLITWPIPLVFYTVVGILAGFCYLFHLFGLGAKKLFDKILSCMTAKVVTKD